MKSKKILNSKRASLEFPLEKVIGYIFGAICFVAIVYFLVILYLWFSNAQDLETAKANVDLLKSNANDLKKIGDSRNVTITGPKDWYMASFKATSELPIKCDDKQNCLCICKGGLSAGYCNSRESSCASFGDVVVYSTYSSKLGVFEKFKITMTNNKEITIEKA